MGEGGATIGSIPLHYTTYTLELDKRNAPLPSSKIIKLHVT